MKTIDIKTTQNVTISYELAEWRDRMIALLIDIICFGLAYLLLFWVFTEVIDFDFEYQEEIIGIILAVPVIMFYSLWMEYFFNGQSLGKRAMQLRVIKLDGTQPGFQDYLGRWSFRLFDIWLSLGVIGTLLISGKDYAQRMGDIVSNTVVVKIRPRATVTLKDILRIDSRQSYEPQYPGISRFHEEDILVIKQTIERYQRHRNQAHQEAIILLSNHMGEKLGVTPPTSDHIKFLRTLIKDYIVLTR